MGWGYGSNNGNNNRFLGYGRPMSNSQIAYTIPSTRRVWPEQETTNTTGMVRSVWTDRQITDEVRALLLRHAEGWNRLPEQSINLFPTGDQAGVNGASRKASPSE